MRTLVQQLLLAIVLLAPGAAQAQADESLPTVRLVPKPELLVVRVQPADGFHLAADLPLRANVTDGYFTFEVNDPAPPETGEARLRLPLVRERRITSWTVSVEGATCADDGTTCVPFHVEQELGRGQLRGVLVAEAGRLPRSHAPPPTKPTKPTRTVPEPADAPTVPRLVLYDFFATWCPPCDRLRDEFLEHPDWADVVETFDVRSLDADDPSSFSLKDQYRVGGYPTVLLTTATGEVLDRIVGFPGSEEMARRLAAARAATGTAEGCSGAVKTARRTTARDVDANAWPALSAACPDPQSFKDFAGLVFAFELAERAEDARALGLALAGAEQAPSEGVAARLGWAASQLLTEQGAAEEAEALEEGLARRIDSRWKAAGLSPEQRIDLADALYYRGQWDPDEKVRLHQAAAEQLARAITDREGVEPGPLPDTLLGLSAKLKHHEGLVHDLVYLLRSAGAHESVGRIYGGMIALFPEAFTWHYAQAGWLLQEGAVDKAEPSARRALEYSYGDMSLRAAKRLADILVAREKLDEAVAVIDAALEAPLPEQQHVRTWRYRTALTALRDTVRPPGPR
ncbi:MAG: thioredoxin family protein [Deltaproteobacteria bacterium]|nr:thioredoxin family protein [Deltaproteobacteria bacterium]